MKALWKLFKKRPGFYINRIDGIFDDLKNNRSNPITGTNAFFVFLDNVVEMGDVIRYRWMKTYLLDVLYIKLKSYDISIKKYNSSFTIRFKEKNIKQIERELLVKKI